jgi:hypothetical protein
MKVKSTLTCFYHGRRYRPGEVFELPEGAKPSADMTVVDGDKPEVKPAKAKAEPKALSEVAKGLGKGSDDLV